MVSVAALVAVAVNTDITSSKNWSTAGQASPQIGLDGQPAFSDHVFAEGAVPPACASVVIRYLVPEGVVAPPATPRHVPSCDP